METKRKRPKTRPRKRWMENLKNDMIQKGLRDDNAQDRKLQGQKIQIPGPGNRMLDMEEGDDYDCHWINKEQLHMCVYLHLKMHTIHNFENENR